MRNIATLLALVFSISAFGQAKPVSMKGQSDAAFQLPKQEIQVPNKQYTNLGGLSGLIETGNKNLLANPGFEHSTYSTGWTVTGSATVSGTTSSSEVLSGKKSFKAVMTGNAVQLTQDTTLYAATLGNVQLFLRMVYTNTAPGAKMCVRKNGVTLSGSNDCVTLATDGVRRTVELAFLGNSTSNGISVATGTTAGTLIVDDVELSTESSSFIDVAQIGPWIDYGPITIGATTTAPTKGTPTTDKVRCRINGSSYECNYKLVGGTGTAGTGDYLISLPSGIEFDDSLPNFTTAGNVRDSADSPASQFEIMGNIRGGTPSGPAAAAARFSANQFRVSWINLFSATGNWSSSLYDLGTRRDTDFTIKFRGKGLSNKITTYSQQCLRDVDCENVFSAKVSAAGVVSGENLDWISGNASISSTSTYAFTFNSGIFTVAPNCTASLNGSLGSSRSSISITSVSASSVVITTFDVDALSAEPFTIDCTKQGADYKAKNVITGSFQNIEKCADPYECTNVYSAKVSSAGVVSGENLDWISGATVSGTSNNRKTITFNSGIFSVAPNCIVQARSSTCESPGCLQHQSIFSITNSTLITNGANNADSAFTATDIEVICQKQGADFKPKTAVAGTYLDAVTSPGAGRPVLCSAKISSTGVISDQLGGCFASCTNATTPVCTFTSNFWRSGMIPECWHRSSSAVVAETITTTTTVAGTIINLAGTPQAVARSYFCQGVQ